MPENDAKPSRIGGFELLVTLGKGGMGTVFKARQVSMDRVVALKVLPPNLAKNQDFVQRFLREARSAAKLNHPNIVQGFDVGEADGVYYFAMEFVDGPTLKDLIKREGRIEERKALNILGGVARALEHAHKHGLIHRDIKPDNVMISRDGVVKLADLGLARSTGKVDTVTIEGVTVGTPHYMAPEQVRGQADLDTRCDIYALGATLYHMATGAFPFEGPNAAAIMAKHLAEEPPSPKEKNPQLSRPTCDLILRMMAKDPADRPQTPTDLLGEIRDALEGKVKLHRLRSAMTREMPAHKAAGPSSPLPPGEGRVRDAAGRGVRRTADGRPNRGGDKPRPYIWLLAAAAVLAAGALFLILRPGNPAQPQAKEKEDLTAKVAKDAKGKEETANHPEAKADADAQLKAQIGELKAACTALAAKGQFGQAIGQIDAFTKKFASDAASDEGVRLRNQVLAQADARYTELLVAVSDALAQKDYPKARAALAPAEALGIPDLADRAKKKLEEIASREKSAEAWATWDGVKSQAKKLADAGQFDDALKLLDGAKAIPLDKIADQIAEQTQSIGDARRALAEKAVAAYAAESDKVWTLFKDRKYADAEKLLADLAASLPKVSYLREGIARPLQADQEAAALLKEFWSAVEKGLAAKAGQFLSFKGAAGGGTLLSVQDGTATVKTPKGEEPRRVQDLVAKQALAHADLKGDAHSNLLKGVFLLAEGQEPEAADKALASAGNPPSLAFYKDRLDRALGRAKAVAEAKDADGREAAARTAWRALLAASKGSLTQAQAKRGMAFLDAFEAKHAGTKFAESIREEAASLKLHLEDATGGWVRLFDGKTLEGWRAFDAHPFAHQGRMDVKDNEILFEKGGPGTGIQYTGDLPRGDYELSLEVMSHSKIGGFLIIAFPIDTSATMVGIDAREDGKIGAGMNVVSESEKKIVAKTKFEEGRWYRIRVRVTKSRVLVLLDEEKLFDWARPQQSFRMPLQWAALVPLGIGNYDTVTSVRNIMVRRLGPQGELLLPKEPGPKAEEPKAGNWISLFDGKTLDGWKVVEGGDDTGHGEVRATSGQIAFGAGKLFTGLAWTRAFPKEKYELAYEAKRVEGSSAFGTVVFPVGKEHVTLTVGGWDGTVVSLHLVDGKAGLDNATAKRLTFENDKWYRVRLRVTKTSVQAWIEDDQVVDLATAGHIFSLDGSSAARVPLGFSSYGATKAALRNVRFRRLGE